MQHIRHDETFIIEYYVSGQLMPGTKEYLKEAGVDFECKQTGLCFTFYVCTNLSDASAIHNGLVEKKLLD